MTETGLAIWLYGSHARGVTDDRSDIDILIVGGANAYFGGIRPRISVPLNGTSISYYTWEEIHGMSAYGSLFLHHLSLEAYPLYESSACRGVLRSILTNIKDYEHVERDLVGFRTVLDDVEEELETDRTKFFELAVLGTVIRHCSILGCWLIDTPCFGRVEPVNALVCSRGLDYRIAKGFPDLYQYRLYMDQRVQRSSLPKLKPSDWARRAREGVGEVEGLNGE